MAQYADPGPPYQTLLGTLPMTWLELKSKNTSLSDSFLPAEAGNASLVYRDVK